MKLEQIIADFKAEFPGWWWSIGECQISCDATVGPTTVAPDAHLLAIWEFDEGFDGDLAQPSSVEEALLNAISIARGKRASANGSLRAGHVFRRCPATGMGCDCMRPCEASALSPDR